MVHRRTQTIQYVISFQFQAKTERETAGTLILSIHFFLFQYYNYILQMFLVESHLSNLYNYLNDDISLDGAYMDYIQSTDVRKALHVGNTNFTSIGVVYRKLVPDFMNSAKMWLEELLENYRVMLYK